MLEARLARAETTLDMARQEAAIEEALAREDAASLRTQLAATKRELQAMAYEVQVGYGQQGDAEEALKEVLLEKEELGLRIFAADAQLAALSSRLQAIVAQLGGDVSETSAQLIDWVAALEAFAQEHTRLVDSKAAEDEETASRMQERVAALEGELVAAHSRMEVWPAQQLWKLVDDTAGYIPDTYNGLHMT